MIFNENGFPRPSGATDWMDSAHAAGLIAFVDELGIVKLKEYLDEVDGNTVLVRCPKDTSGLNPSNYKNCTRDQLICYMSGLYNLRLTGSSFRLLQAAKARGYRAQNTEKDIPGSTKRFPDGADILDPSHIGYMKICAGLKTSWFQRLLMLVRIKIASKFSQLKEPNNIIVMSVIYKYATVLVESNPRIYEAVDLYWKTWRNEPELAEMLKKKLRDSVELEKLENS